MLRPENLKLAANFKSRHLFLCARVSKYLSFHEIVGILSNIEGVIMFYLRRYDEIVRAVVGVCDIF